jgi:Flp pilus assembly protein TadD
VDVPGHIFLLVDTGLLERNRSTLGVDSTLMVITDQRVWIPLETTSLAQGFAKAWRDGADEIATGTASDTVRTYDVTEAQVRYEPATPPGERRIRTLDEARFSTRLKAEAKTVSSMREEYFATRYGAGTRELEASAEALDEVARVEFEGGDLQGARSHLEGALAKAPHAADVHNNLGVVLAAMDSVAVADEQWRTALAIGRPDPGIALNRGIACWARGDSAGAVSLLGAAVVAAGGHAAACKLVGLSPEDAQDRAADFSDAELLLRGRIRNLLRANVVAGGEKGRVPSRPPGSEFTSPNAPLRQVSKYLYWIE